MSCVHNLAIGSSVTDISELEQRLRDLPVQGKDVFESESDDLEGKEPRDYRPWINAANPSLPSCKFCHFMLLPLNLPL